MVGVFFKNTQQDYAKSLLGIYQQQPLIRWDEMGQLQSPVSVLNILDVIKYMTSATSLSLKEKDLLRLLHSFAPIPLEYVRNPTAKRFLSGRDYKGGGSTKSMPAFASKHMRKKMRWNPY